MAQANVMLTNPQWATSLQTQAFWQIRCNGWCSHPNRGGKTKMKTHVSAHPRCTLACRATPVSYTHLRAHETSAHL
eukprot:9735199-Alexandrium_andersonii.AAC.1